MGSEYMELIRRFVVSGYAPRRREEQWRLPWIGCWPRRATTRLTRPASESTPCVGYGMANAEMQGREGGVAESDQDSAP